MLIKRLRMIWRTAPAPDVECRRVFFRRRRSQEFLHAELSANAFARSHAAPCLRSSRLLRHSVLLVAERFSATGHYGISAAQALALHSALMLAARITLPHFSLSSAISLPKLAGVPGSTVPPKSASRAFIVGSARPALISLLSVSMILAGVFLGAPRPPMRPADGPSNGWATLSRIRSLADYTIAMLESSFRKRQPIIPYKKGALLHMKMPIKRASRGRRKTFNSRFYRQRRRSRITSLLSRHG
jgi:hypothetical protein